MAQFSRPPSLYWPSESNMTPPLDHFYTSVKAFDLHMQAEAKWTSALVTRYGTALLCPSQDRSCRICCTRHPELALYRTKSEVARIFSLIILAIFGGLQSPHFQSHRCKQQYLYEYLLSPCHASFKGQTSASSTVLITIYSPSNSSDGHGASCDEC